MYLISLTNKIAQSEGMFFYICSAGLLVAILRPNLDHVNDGIIFLMFFISSFSIADSYGVHVVIPAISSYYLDIFNKLGFVELPVRQEILNEKKIVVLGRSF